MAYINVDINETEIFISCIMYGLNPIEEELQNFIIRNN